jgi:hypothetical protein
MRKLLVFTTSALVALACAAARERNLVDNSRHDVPLLRVPVTIQVMNPTTGGLVDPGADDHGLPPDRGADDAGEGGGAATSDELSSAPGEGEAAKSFSCGSGAKEDAVIIAKGQPASDCEPYASCCAKACAVEKRDAEDKPACILNDVEVAKYGLGEAVADGGQVCGCACKRPLTSTITPDNG